MDDLVLLGTKAAGKTTMLSIIRGKGVPENPAQTDGHTKSDYKKINHKFDNQRDSEKLIDWSYLGNGIRNFIDKYKIHDTGGKDTNTSADYKDWIDHARRVCFVFDGTEFLKEIEGDTGGEIGMRIRNWLLPNYNFNGKTSRTEDNNAKKKSINSLFFIASHEDLYSGDLKNDIIEKIESANKRYQSLSKQNILRYPYLALLSDYSHFYSVNSADEEKVLKIFNEIFKVDIKEK